MSHWSAADATELYNLAHWGEGYFSVGAHGHLHVHPHREGAGVDLHAMVQQLQQQHQLRLPLLLRFTDILHDRVQRLTHAFDQALAQHASAARYTAVYPIKVNQQRSVVAHILGAGMGRVGLEAGSKPELMAVLGLAPAGATIVCNGYKDTSFIRAALIGQKLGHKVYIVVEKLTELDIVLREAARLDVAPLLGIRVRLASISAGNWQNTGGEKSKFGLSAGQLLEAVARLQQAGQLATLKMAHCHLGSQVANLRDVRGGMRELARFYAELRALGAPIDCVDVGGGLGVDYEGSRSRSYCSMNYSLDDYARAVVDTLMAACQQGGLPMPDIISESGRALTAHHAVLIANVVDHEQPPLAPAAALPDDAAPVLRELWLLLQNHYQQPPGERLSDADSNLNLAQELYQLGQLDLPGRAQAEALYYAICQQVHAQLDLGKRAHRQMLDSLREKLAQKYFCNFSLFQSLPDVWAIEQIFPVLPIHRLDEAPDTRIAICDLTCDSDGRIDRYVDSGGLDNTLPAHTLRAGEAYLLGFFMVGAYQEILGDIHNLFGDTDAVDIAVSEADPAGWTLLHAEAGDRADELLEYLHFTPSALRDNYREKAQASIADAALRETLLAELEAGLSGYTYLGS